ncbi:hypothetical protein Tco_1497550, partial [Tanacetum coccineum]
MAPLPSRDQRHPWLRYQVHILDFAGLTEGMRQTLGDRLRMIYTKDEGQKLFTSHTWRRLFEIKAPLVREFILQFLSTCRMSDTEMGLDVADTLCFQLGGARRKMTWRQFILALGLHTEEEMMEISSDRDLLGPDHSYVFIRDPVRRLCHRIIACSISDRHAEGRKSGARLSGVTSLGVL